MANVGLLLNGAGTFATEDAKNAEIPNAFFVSAFTAKAIFQETPDPGDQGESLEEARFSLHVGELDYRPFSQT